MSEKIRAVMVGCGGICGAWFGSSSVQELVEVVGLVDINRQSAEARAKEFAFDNAIIGTDLATVLTTTNPDVVFNCTIPDAHFEVTMTALRHGCHVLVEKPLADTMENARAMVDAAQQAGKIFAVIQNRRYDPHIRRLRAFLDAGIIGKITTVHCRFLLNMYFGDDNFRTVMPHVLIHDMAIHTFDAARFLTRAIPLSVYCQEWNPSDSKYQRDVSAAAIFEMSNGIIYTYQGSWCPKGLNTSWESAWHIIGERGSAFWDGAEFRAEALDDTGKMVEMLIPEIDLDDYRIFHDGNILEFLTCIRSGETPETIGSDNIHSLAMVLSAIDSSKAGKKIEINI